MALTICNLISHNCFRLMKDWKLQSLANGTEISAIPFQTEKEDCLWRQSAISKRIFRKITVTFDFQPKFPDFLLNGKHPEAPLAQRVVKLSPILSQERKKNNCELIFSQLSWLTVLIVGAYGRRRAAEWHKKAAILQIIDLQIGLRVRR